MIKLIDHTHIVFGAYFDDKVSEVVFVRFLIEIELIVDRRLCCATVFQWKNSEQKKDKLPPAAW